MIESSNLVPFAKVPVQLKVANRERPPRRSRTTLEALSKARMIAFQVSGVSANVYPFGVYPIQILRRAQKEQHAYKIEPIMNNRTPHAE